MQVAGIHSDEFAGEGAREVWRAKYRLRGDGREPEMSVEQTWRRIAGALARVEPHDQSRWERRFFEALSGFRFLPGGRIQAGAGTGRRVTLFNCFVMGTIGDSMDGIFDALKEGALTMQQGGGVGYDFSTLRPKGMAAKSGGTIASGPVSFMHIWDAMCGTILSTGARRGAMMGTLRCDHPDIGEFVEVKRDPAVLRRFNLSVLATDDFMRAVREGGDWPLVFPADGAEAPGAEFVERVWSGDARPRRCRVFRRVAARALWERIMRATYDCAEPGVIFIDRVRRANNLSYCEQIAATNPCVTAETWVHTTEGPRQVHELVGRPFVSLVNGQAYDSGPSGFFSTGSNPIYRLKTAEGYGLRLTADHPVLRVTERTRWTLHSEWTKAENLKPGDSIFVHNHRTATEWAGPFGEPEGYLLGLLIGDGTFSETTAELRVWPDAAVVNDEAGAPGIEAVMRTAEAIAMSMPHRSDFTGWRRSLAGYHYMRLAHFTRIAEELGVMPGRKTVTPAIERCSSGFYRGFLRGMFDTDGSIQGSQAKGVSVRLAQSDESLLEAVQRMLLRLGIASVVYRERRSAGTRLLPDGRGGQRMYECRADHELVIAGDNLLVFAETIGFADTRKQARLAAALSRYKRALNRERFIAIFESIEHDGAAEVFDVQIPGVNGFDANGLCVHNCGEIPLPPYGACDLGSINLTRFVRDPFGPQARIDLEAVATTAALGVRMLDNVYEISNFPLPRQREVALASRRVGLGITGLADTLTMLGVPYASPRALEVAEELMRTVCLSAYRASIRLAREKGGFPQFRADEYTGSEFVRRLPHEIVNDIRRHGIRNSHLTAVAPAGTISLLAGNVSSGLEPAYAADYRRSLRAADGSLKAISVTDYACSVYRQLGGADSGTPPAFVAASNVDPYAQLAMQGALQRYVDNSISKTVSVPAEFGFEGFSGIYQRAYELGLKGCTTYRPNTVTGAVLQPEGVADHAAQCCSAEREAD